MKVLAIIPARGGSKGILRKNIANLSGKPLIVHTLNAAREANSITDVMISTEDEEIAAICRAEGVHTPYRRPPELATDHAGMAETIIDAVDWWSNNNSEEPELIALLQPTSPLRNARDIDGAIKLLRGSGRESVASVHEMREHPMECVKFTGTSWTMLVQPPKGSIGRQDYGERFYFINGAVYVVTPSFLRREKVFMREGGETVLYVMDPWRGIDIDYPADLKFAEAIMNYYKQ